MAQQDTEHPNESPNIQLETTLKLLVENLQSISSVLSIHMEQEENSMKNIELVVSKIPLKNIEEALDSVKRAHNVVEDIMSRVSEHTKVAINKRDLDFVLSELVVEAYSSISKKKRYSILKELGFWAFGVIGAIGLGLVIKLILDIIAKI